MSTEAWIHRVLVKIVREGARLPERKTDGAAGYDVYALSEQPVLLYPGVMTKIPTGLAFEMKPYMMGLILPRSSTALAGLRVEHPPIDPDYRGEVHVICSYHRSSITSPVSYTINPGDRIAQIVFLHHYSPRLELVDELRSTARGEGGFGSTGD